MSGPLCDSVAFLVREFPDDDHDEINQSPNTQSAEREKLNDTCANFPHVEAVRAKHTKAEAEKESWQDFLVCH
jgi:hypothetical protein